ncbi:hypothetical protein [Enterococcus casseliflavus]|uniref:hypothetical protein n=1 Tax=Enterococcus casseliflavus TaxID=37734 RepID=UPI0030177D83
MKKTIINIKSNIEFKAIAKKGKMGFILDDEFVKLDLSTFPRNTYGYTNIEYITLDSLEVTEKYIRMIEWYINNTEKEETRKKLYRTYNKLTKAQEKFAILESE